MKCLSSIRSNFPRNAAVIDTFYVVQVFHFEQLSIWNVSIKSYSKLKKKKLHIFPNLHISTHTTIRKLTIFLTTYIYIEIEIGNEEYCLPNRKKKKINK